MGLSSDARLGAWGDALTWLTASPCDACRDWLGDSLAASGAAHLTIGATISIVAGLVSDL